MTAGHGLGRDAAGGGRVGSVPEDAVEIVRRIYARWSTEEANVFPDLMSAEIEYVNPPGAIEPGTRRGIEVFAGAVAKVREAWELWSMEPEEIVKDGALVIVVLRYRARGRGSGTEVDGRESALWTVDGGKAVRYEWFQAPDEAAREARRRRVSRSP
jgi:ketosteroid isomerase-like protein